MFRGEGGKTSFRRKLSFTSRLTVEVRSRYGHRFSPNLPVNRSWYPDLNPQSFPRYTFRHISVRVSSKSSQSKTVFWGRWSENLRMRLFPDDNREEAQTFPEVVCGGMPATSCAFVSPRIPVRLFVFTHAVSFRNKYVCVQLECFRSWRLSVVQVMHVRENFFTL